MNGKNGGYYYESLPQPLSNQEFLYYFQLYKNGNETAFHKLINHNMRLVVSIARKFQNVGIALEELISAGSLGLIKAVKTFDLDKKAKFSAYASACIRNEILMVLRYLKKYCSKATCVSIDGMMINKRTGNPYYLIDILSTDDDFVDEYCKAEKYREVRESLSILSKREKQVITMLYGFDGQILTQTEVGKIMSTSQSSVSRLDKNARKKIREFLSESYHSNQLECSSVERTLNNEMSCVYYANMMLKDDLTIEELAARCGVSADNILDSFYEQLIYIEPTLYIRVQRLMNFQYAIEEKRQKLVL